MKKFLATAVFAGLATLFVACDDKKADSKPQAPAATQEDNKAAETMAPAQEMDKDAVVAPAATQEDNKAAETAQPSK